MAEYDRKEFDKLYDDVANGSGYTIPTEEEYDQQRLDVYYAKVHNTREHAADHLEHHPEKLQRRIDETVNQHRARMGMKSYAETNGFVHKYQEMDPNYDGFLFDGTELVDGMVVLADIRIRVDVDLQLDPQDYYRARLYNRWFQVSNLTVEHKNVTMQANYEDGTKARIVLSTDHSWLYKLGTESKSAGTAQVPGQMEIKEDGRIQEELNRLRKEDFGG
jgi:hypothetical protein